MATTTRMEWADATTNTAVGCSHCSPGCDHCYAEKFAHRLSKNPVATKVYAGVVDERGKWTGKINSNFSEKMYPHRVPGKGKRVFVGSMTDIFHPNYPADNRDELFASIMADCIFSNGHGHTYIVLTKRAQAMAEYFSAGPEVLLRRWGKAGNGWIIVGDGESESFEEYAEGQTIPQHGHEKYPSLRHEHLWPLPNLWLGVTVCNQSEADTKIPALLATPAAKRFVSLEPLLGAISLSYLQVGQNDDIDALRGIFHQADHWNPDHDGTPTGSKLDWVIVGGETGPSSRPMHPDWVRSLRDQCQEAAVPFFFKGWGGWKPSPSSRPLSWSTHMICSQTANVVESSHTEKIRNTMWGISRVGKKRAGRLLDDREWDEVPS